MESLNDCSVNSTIPCIDTITNATISDDLNTITMTNTFQPAYVRLRKDYNTLVTINIRSTDQGENTTVHVEDPNLYSSIKANYYTSCASFDDSTRDITVTEACQSSVTTLTLMNDIEDISPLPTLFPYLTTLNQMSGQVSDVSPLTNLANLTTLGIGVQISDANISQLASMTSLTTLGLNNSQISDISQLADLANLPNLTSLTLGNNQISDLSPLPNLLPNLRTLSLAGNQISDVSPLASMTNLQTLYLSNNQISDVSPLDNLTNTMITATGQVVTLEYSEKTFTSPQILTYTKDLYKNYDIVDCADEPDVTGTSMLIQVCAEITNGLLSDDYATITADDTTQPVKIVLYTKMYMMGTMFNNTEAVSLTFIPASTESDAVDTPNTLDDIYLYLPATIILVVGGIILTKKYSRSR